MPKLKPATQRARREHILDAAAACFARAGFHRTTMQDICKEALISPGALYVYFASKEDLIAGISERDRAEFAERFAEVSAAPDTMKGLAALGEHYFVEEAAQKLMIGLEIGLESTRNPKVGEIYRAVDRFVTESFEKLFRRLAAEGRIAPDLDIATVARLFSLIGDGMCMRRALDPDFDAKTLVPAALKLVAKLLNPVAEPPEPLQETDTLDHEKAKEPRR